MIGRKLTVTLTVHVVMPPRSSESSCRIWCLQPPISVTGLVKLRVAALRRQVALGFVTMMLHQAIVMDAA